MDIIFFIYGLSFFSLGILVLFTRPKNSDLFYADKIWLLGVFAILHAILEWISLYGYLYPSHQETLIPYEVFFLLISYLFLFEFSRFIVRKSFENPNSKLHFIYDIYAAPVIYIVTTAILLSLIMINPGLNETIVAIRYTYGFWSSLFLGLGLYFYGESLKKLNHIKDLKLYFKIAGITFLFYAFFAGIIVPPIVHFPGNFINSKVFLETFGVPVQLFRLMCAFIIAITSVKALEIFKNEVAEKLNESFEQIKEFNSNASHQIKTPLSSMKVQIDVTLQRDREANEYKSILNSIGDEITSLQKMVTNLLLLTRMRDDTIKEKFIDIEIDDIVLHIVGEYMILASQKKININIEELESLVVRGDKTLITILITNLIDNAIKYTHSNKNINISLKGATFTIEDEGIGIQKEKIPYIFQKFFQVDSSQQRSLSGYGLGLSMVKKIADLHKISLFVQSKKDIGTTITVKF